jgi:hypothetical protein
MDNIFKGCPARMDDGRFFTDYRTANTRNQYIKTINGLVRDDDYRGFLQQNTNTLMDNEWNYMKQYSCTPKVCFHQYPTRVTNGENYNELTVYDAVKLGKMTPQDKGFPICDKFEDYRMSITKNTKF